MSTWKGIARVLSASGYPGRGQGDMTLYLVDLCIIRWNPWLLGRVTRMSNCLSVIGSLVTR